MSCGHSYAPATATAPVNISHLINIEPGAGGTITLMETFRILPPQFLILVLRLIYVLGLPSIYLLSNIFCFVAFYYKLYTLLIPII